MFLASRSELTMYPSLLKTSFDVLRKSKQIRDVSLFENWTKAKRKL